MKTRHWTGPTPNNNPANIARLTALLALIFAATLFDAPGALAAEQGQSAPLAELTSIRVANHTRYQRVVIDTSAAVSYSILEDAAPLTLRIDDIQAARQSLIWADLGQLKGATIEQASDHTVHIVFDLTGPVRPRASSYTPDSYGGHRIVIDLWPLKKPEDIHEPKKTHEIERINEKAVEALIHQPTANQTSGLTSEESWPDLGSTDGDEAEDLMEVPGLKVVQQWPDLLEEAAKTIKENESASAIPAEHGTPPTHEVPENVAGLELKPALPPSAITDDPITAARRSLAQGQPDDACKVLQVNYPKGTWNIEAMVLQGACLSALGKLVDANTLYTEVLSYEPANVEARLGLAKAQANAGDYTAARDNYTRALETMADGDRKDETRKLLQEVEDQIKHAIH